MKALVKTSKTKGLELKDMPMPSFNENEVLIKVKLNSICGTDLHIYEWDSFASEIISPPLIVGHEFMGEIEAIGKNVTHLKVGDRVSGEGHIGCGICRNCLGNKRHLCPTGKGIGVTRDGAFAEYIVLPASNVIPIPKYIPDKIAAILDPLGNAVHTALTFDIIGEDILITGAGSIGLMSIAVAKFIAAKRIVVTDISDLHLKMAKSFGATLVCNVKKESLQETIANYEKLNQEKMSFEFTVGFEMSGHNAALDTQIDFIHPAGRIALLGIFPEKEVSAWNKIILKGLTLKGIHGRKMFETWHKMIALLETGLDVSAVITHQLPIEKFEEAFSLQARGEAGKILLTWD